MNVIKPLQLMHKQTVIEQDNRFHCVFSASLGFRLSSDETLLEMDALNESFLAMGNNPMPDLGMPKPKSEYLVSGKYYSPGGEPVRGGEVKVEFENQSKSLYIFGDRTWEMGVPSEASLITELPLDYAHAFGGSNYAKNPVGIGYEEERLPNIENPDQILTSPKATIQPAGLGVLDLRSEQRVRYQGTYDDTYLQKYYPGYPADFDWHSFMCSSQDQWSDSYYTGVESFSLHNLHPEKPLISGRLPGFQARCFIQQGGQNDLKELNLNLDTVWFFPEQDLGFLIWRGGLDVNDDEADDIKHLLLAYEHRNDKARDKAYYQTAFNQLNSGKDVLIKQMSSVALIPDAEKCAMQLLQDNAFASEESEFGKNLDAKAKSVSELSHAKVEEALKEMKAQTPEQEHLKNKDIINIEEILKKKAPDTKDKDIIEMNEALEKLLPGITSGDPKKIQFKGFSFEKIDAIMLEVEKLLEKKKDFSQQQVDKVKQELQQSLEKEIQAMGASTDESIVNTQETLKQLDELDHPAASPLPRIDVNSIVSELDKLTPQTMEAMQNLQSLKAMGNDDESTRQIEEMIRQSTTEQDQQRKESLLEVEHEFKAMYRETAHFLDNAESPHKNSIEERRQEFLDAVSRSDRVRGQDWSCLNLSGLQLDDIDLSDCYLEQVDFTGASLRNANLSGAILARANLSKADFSGSNFKSANVGAVNASGADFSGCDFNSAKLSKGDFSGSTFHRAQLEEVECLELVINRADFTDARLNGLKCIQLEINGAKFNGTQLASACFMQCKLEHCDFTNANLQSTVWAETPVSDTTFNQSDMTSACFASADPELAKLEQVSFVGACLNKANFQGVQMPMADLSGAYLIQANFSSANLYGANLSRSVAHNALFRKANLNNANLDKIDLKEGSMGKAKLSGAVLTGANLFAVDLLRATVGETLFNDSNLDNTIIQDWRPS